MRPSITLRYIVDIGFRPRRAAEQLLADPGHLQHGVTAWLWIGLIYGLTAFVGGLNGVGASTEPSLRLPSARYYLWMGPATPLLYLLNFLVIAGSIHLLAKLAKGRGSYEQTFAVTALTFVLPVVLTMWVFEMPLLVFFPHLQPKVPGGLWILPAWFNNGRQWFGLIWIFFILGIATSRVQRLSIWKALPITLAAFIFGWAVELTYLR